MKGLVAEKQTLNLNVNESAVETSESYVFEGFFLSFLQEADIPPVEFMAPVASPLAIPASSGSEVKKKN